MVYMPPGRQAPKRQPSLRGLVMQDIVRGQTRVRAWPAKRGKPKTKAEKEANDLFRIVQKAAAYLAPGCLAYIHKATQGSPLLIRDVVTMQLYNRWMAFTLEDGTQIMPMTAIQDVSDALDVLGKDVDYVLIRRPEGWRTVSREAFLPAQANTAVVSLVSNVASPGGVATRLPFNSVEQDPAAWWSGPPLYEYRVPIAGNYFVSLTTRRTSTSIIDTAIIDADTLGSLQLSDSPTQARIKNLATVLPLAAGQGITTRLNGNGAGTLEGFGPANFAFRIAGPL